jgi:4-amino-4-deoxy-L-arabinose transferase-like glycosyltransferase
MNEAENARLYKITAAIIAAVTLVRLAVLIVSPLELYPDEAQYWFWAQTPDLGYFSKPPMIAWIVWLTTTIFGNSEWAIRISVPLLHAGTALFIYGIGKRTADARVGMWSALAYLTLPGISYSCGLVSTDVPLLFFWSLALYAFIRALDEPGWLWSIVCGIGFGLGLLSKYAMLYFVLGAVLAAIAIPKVRALVLSFRGLAILLIGLALLSPNIWWNAAHGFPTVAHTEANADWGHARYNIVNALSFLGGQFGVFGPVMMAALLIGLWQLARRRDDRDLLLAAFSVPVLLIITVQAFISEANANWAAVGYVAAVPLAVSTMFNWVRRWPLRLSFAFNGLAMVLLWIVLVWPGFAEWIGQGNAFKRQEGWRQLGIAVVEEAWNAPYDTVVVANRSLIAEMMYYARTAMLPIRMWDSDNHADNHFEMAVPLTRASHHMLLVIFPGEGVHVLPTFDSAKLVHTVTIAVGGHHTRVTQLFDARDYRGPQAHR